jgi:nucleoside-diphosphate-sugar epimerase
LETERVKQALITGITEQDDSRFVASIAKFAPDKVYNLAAQFHFRVSFDEREYPVDTVELGTTRLLEAIRVTGVNSKFYQASSPLNSSRDLARLMANSDLESLT